MILYKEPTIKRTMKDKQLFKPATPLKQTPRETPSKRGPPPPQRAHEILISENEKGYERIRPNDNPVLTTPKA